MEWNKAKTLESVGGDQELLDELIALFIDTMETDLSAIRVGLAEQDGVKASDAAHSIKGSALALDFDEIRVVAEKVEKECKKGDLDSTPQNIELLSVLLGEVKRLF